MGYYLEAVIAAEPLLRAATTAPVVPLAQGLALLPMTDELHDALLGGGAPVPPFRRLPNGFQHTLAAWSATGPVAYVEADIWGGTGDQYAAVWEAGALVLGPLASRRAGPLSEALRRLGAQSGDHLDEFDAVGLGRHRRTEGWLGDED